MMKYLKGLGCVGGGCVAIAILGVVMLALSFTIGWGIGYAVEMYLVGHPVVLGPLHLRVWMGLAWMIVAVLANSLGGE